ncbi:hypothetical protein [Pseudoduganella buxea]|uniref:Uncharacterized protein n=1 Tax=Pseudoduganella buxea TaxID=1949069 RepID=A0A6I3SU81_9BURK|nr:hypothetical protein [Pseudoduganella buxea]MTV52718.1 hypothetical protein [Pseudoduganella buxea]GGC18689.1 hypothetical protein GCM10011572_45200 [Pseudoduganella buxea]
MTTSALPRLLAAALVCGFLLLALLPAAHAAPAPWWLWESVTSGDKVCSQTPLGKGWRKLLGPYRDSRCEKPFRTR